MQKEHSNSPSETEAEAFKESANKLFHEGHFDKSIELYTQAIDKVGIRHPKSAVYLCNRAFANIKMENYGCALTDAEAAMEADPLFPKSYYRQSSCFFALGKLDDSIKALERIVKSLKLTNISDVNDRIKFLKQMKREREFLECIQYENELDKANENELVVEPGYDGPVIEADTPIDLEFVKQTLEYLRGQRKLHKKYLWVLIKRAKLLLDKEPNIVPVTVDGTRVKEITVCGDIHGQFYDFLNILSLNGYPSEERPYLFNGDFVDRGSFSVECVVGLLLFKVMHPRAMFLNRGNHENPDMNKLYGFEGEVLAKYCNLSFALFKDLFYSLPLVHLLNSKVLVLHGGLFEKDGVKLVDINKISRRMAIPATGLMCDMLWADPTFMPGRHKSKRGISIEFGPDVAARFLDDNGLGELTRPAGAVASGQGDGVRGRGRAASHHHLLGAQVLRPNDQQGGLHRLQERHEAQLLHFRGRGELSRNTRTSRRCITPRGPTCSSGKTGRVSRGFNFQLDLDEVDWPDRESGR